MSFWQSDQCLTMVNPRDKPACREAELIQTWVNKQSDLKGHLLFSTSGSTGAGKWVALSKQALLTSARMVNEHLAAKENDRWLCALPEFHVGGMGILARCYQAGSSVVGISGKWAPQSFLSKLVAEEITLTSLVPTQLVDLVQGGFSAPPALRAVLIGGGRLDDQIYSKAITLGWPVMETYGMTETCSQVATASLGSRDLTILPGWDVNVNQHSCLMVKGDAILTGYVSCNGGAVQINDPKQDGWFVSSDMGYVKNNTITVKGRVDRCVKVLGELINLADVERRLADIFPESDRLVGLHAVVAVPDGRTGSRLVLCVEPGWDHHELLAGYNEHCHPVERVDSVLVLDGLPQSAMGKVRYAELTAHAVKLS